MGFVVLPALTPDVSAVYDVYFAAFKNNAVTRALFPSATEADLTDPNSEFRYVLQSCVIFLLHSYSRLSPKMG